MTEFAAAALEDEHIAAYATLALERVRPLINLAGGLADAGECDAEAREMFLRGVLYAFAANDFANLNRQRIDEVDGDDIAAWFATLLGLMQIQNESESVDDLCRELVPSAFSS